MWALGDIHTVDLRTIFQDEAQHFTPWLAEQERLDQLGEALNLDLSFIEAEGEVGSLRVDIVAESDLGVVVIENQLDKTDHDHLGKLLSYAAGRDARVLIWVATELKDEHRAALDWLNRWTPEDLEIYGVEVRAIQIDQSNPAVEFRPVAFPNTWSRHAQTRSASMSDDEKDLRLAFFEELIDKARDLGLRPTSKAPATRSKSFFCQDDILKRGFRYWVDLKNNQAVVKLEVQRGNDEVNNRVHVAMRARREEIVRELGFEFDVSPPETQCRVRVTRPASIFDSPKKTPRDPNLDTGDNRSVSEGARIPLRVHRQIHRFGRGKERS